MTEQAPSTGRFVWCDLWTSDLEAAKTFYLTLFPAWRLASSGTGPGGAYHELSLDGRGIGGMMVPVETKVPSRWVPYATVTSVEEACEKVKSLGGRVYMPPTDAQGVGRFAVTADAQGAVFHPITLLEEPPEHSGPMPDGAFCWHELHTPDPASAAAFYTSILGWSHAEIPTPMGPYHLFRRGDRDAAGILPMPAGAAAEPGWLVYIYASDVEATSAKVVSLGGKILLPSRQMPGVGQFAVCSDPTGATFALFRSERA